ncbi:MAG TPA: VOC family protein [Thermoanaerobaculia bacterium]|nr:VOC family protein [Thermoanaerobaculia bacterium]
MKVVPMIHVPDVRATAAWYESIGFGVPATHSDDGEMSWALLTFGTTEVMLNEGGTTSAAHRREVDLYVHVEDVAALFERLNGRVEVVEALHDTAYGMREFIIRDLNRFWITFGQPIRT